MVNDCARTANPAMQSKHKLESQYLLIFHLIKDVVVSTVKIICMTKVEILDQQETFVKYVNI